MRSVEEDRVALPIDERRFQKIFGTEELRRVFKPKAQSIPTLDGAALRLEAMEEESLPTFDATDLMVESVAEPGAVSVAANGPASQKHSGMPSPAKVR